LIDFWSRVLNFFDIKKAPKISRLSVGVDPVELRESPRPYLQSQYLLLEKGIKKASKISRLDVGVDPDAIGRTPDPLLVRKKSPISRFS
jgi:hypothetical protein